ncbi:768_t:CDS:1, partial [Funneliformis mosseae]
TSEDDNILSHVKLEEGEISYKELNLVDDISTYIKRDDINQKLKDILSKVFINTTLEYYNKMEKAYNLANFASIYFNCDSLEYIMPIPEKQYPYCE